jgi:hypothetical protein
VYATVRRSATLVLTSIDPFEPAKSHPVVPANRRLALIFGHALDEEALIIPLTMLDLRLHRFVANYCFFLHKNCYDGTSIALNFGAPSR